MRYRRFMEDMRDKRRAESMWGDVKGRNRDGGRNTYISNLFGTTGKNGNRCVETNVRNIWLRVIVGVCAETWECGTDASGRS